MKHDKLIPQPLLFEKEGVKEKDRYTKALALRERARGSAGEGIL